MANKQERHFFNVFRSQEELDDYLKRPESEWDEEKGRFDFEQCLFVVEVHFLQLSEFDNRVYFQNAVFKEKVSFEGKKFRKTVDFNGCRFEKEVIFKGVEFEDEANFCSFHGHVSFHKARFKSSTFFWSHFQGVADFSLCIFNEYADFTDTIFEDEVDFYGATFNKMADFEKSEFRSKVNGWEMVFKDGTSFKWANFRKKVNMSSITVREGRGTLNLHGVNFESNAYFYNSDIGHLDLKKSVIEKGIFFLETKIESSNRETFRIIKHEFLKQNNRIEALKFHQREMIAHIRELYSELKNLDLNIKTPGIIGDMTILILNFISNGFGLWWFMGFAFLIVTTVPLFEWYVDSLRMCEGVSFWRYYPQFLLPIHKFDFIENATLTNSSYVIDFLGRVVSFFGIYQFVQAFRKFGRF